MTGRRAFWEVTRISGRRRGRARAAVSRGSRYQQVEIEYGPFERRVELADDVDPERATASYEAGMLRLEVPLR